MLEAVMNKKNMLIGVAASALLLSGCGFLNNNNNEKAQQADTQTENKNESSSNTKQNNVNQTQQNNTQSQQSKQEDKGYIYPKNTREYYAQIFLTARDNLSVFDGSVGNVTYEPVDISGTLVNPYNEDATVNFPDGTIGLYPSALAAGSVTFRDNNDGTVTFYNALDRFHDHGWFEDEFSLRESRKIIDNGRTMPIKDSPQSDINYVAQFFPNKAPEASSAEAFEGYETDRSSSSSSSESSSSSSGTTVTRSNVIDLVEDYEGHLLDTSTYTYKEPEQMPDGRWGFSILDKAGNLAGSYIIDTDGTVTKYDEKGQPV